MKLQSHSPAKITESLCRRIIKLNFQVVEYFFPYLPVQDKQVYDVIIIRIIDFLSTTFSPQHEPANYSQSGGEERKPSNKRKRVKR